MQRSRNYVPVVVVFALVTGCTGSGPTSPSSAPSSPAAPLAVSIEMSANAPTGTMFAAVDCSDTWDFYSCSKELHLTFVVRSNHNSDLASLDTEFLTSDGQVCGSSSAETTQPLSTGVAATFRTTVVILRDYSCALPFRTARVVARVMDHPNPRVNTGAPPIELIKQGFPIDFTFANVPTSP